MRKNSMQEPEKNTVKSKGKIRVFECFKIKKE
jgi:hypothetical protein